MIDGVKLKDLRVTPDDRGMLMEIWRSDDPDFQRFGQCYITCVYPGVVKAWHNHKKQTDHFVCVSGMAKVALHDTPESSPTRGETNDFIIGWQRQRLLIIPPGVYHGFTAVGPEPAAFLHTDILRTHTLLEVMRELGIARMMQVSTDEVYGSIDEGSFAETRPISPSSPYSASKAGGDLQVLAYRRTYGLLVMITRGSNTYGPYQHPEKLIPLFVTNALEGEQLPL